MDQNTSRPTGVNYQTQACVHADPYRANARSIPTSHFFEKRKGRDRGDRPTRYPTTAVGNHAVRESPRLRPQLPDNGLRFFSQPREKSASFHSDVPSCKTSTSASGEPVPEYAT